MKGKRKENKRRSREVDEVDRPKMARGSLVRLRQVEVR